MVMDSPLITPINLSKICRVCLTEPEELHSIFNVLQNEDSEEGDLMYIYEVLMNISSIKILNEDRMPNTLCTVCLELANTSYKFQQQCNQSQIILETYLTQLNNDKGAGTIRNLNSKKNLSSTETVACLPNSKDIDDNSLDGSNFININPNDTQYVESNLERDQKVAVINEFYKTEIKTEEEEESVTVNDTEIINVNIKLERKVYSCKICDKSYRSSSSLRAHMRTHSSERPFKCQLCGKDFKHYGSLSYHKLCHSSEKAHKCQLCGKRYKQAGSLRTHMRVHTGQRPYLCSICGRGFRQSPDLRYHMRTHTKEKPYMCNVCGKTMSMQCHLVQHMRTHTGERPFKCTECDKAFPSTTRLKRHAIIHTGLKPYKCEVCGSAFNRTNSLRVHEKIHTDDRPHVCPVCGKRFIQANTLRNHVATHCNTVATVKYTL
ncbi:zinc-finger associated domain containing protein [Oryctes borbonicus]|uniref:Zinc-finger associated domain containing protein n=1 Tax=Oryctes borbonicus TaxID=1629725 RepID=A0A0T6AZJ0_9SCAR|nr:zinc-finger associated domain containing protein [Oryctes borbonicus]